MNINLSRVICTCLALVPFITEAQLNIINAFDAIKNCKDAEITETHFLQNEPATGVKTGQSDVYVFTLPSSKKNLVDNVLRAFGKDSATAYSTGSGEKSADGKDILIATGDGTSNNVTLTTPDCRYIYACFLAPKEEDPDGNYRYAYGMSYDDDDGEITGRLVVTYATTMKHRQDTSTVSRLRDLSRVETWANEWNDAKEPWFRVFMRYVTSLGYSNAHTRPTNAGYLYEVTSSIDKYANVSEQDKKTARGILETLIKDNANSDPVVQQILKSALENLK